MGIGFEALQEFSEGFPSIREQPNCCSVPGLSATAAREYALLVCLLPDGFLTNPSLSPSLSKGMGPKRAFMCDFG